MTFELSANLTFPGDAAEITLVSISLKVLVSGWNFAAKTGVSLPLINAYRSTVPPDSYSDLSTMGSPLNSIVSALKLTLSALKVNSTPLK